MLLVQESTTPKSNCKPFLTALHKRCYMKNSFYRTIGGLHSMSPSDLNPGLFLFDDVTPYCRHD